MQRHVSELQFDRMELGKTIIAKCSVCKRRFTATPNSAERTDDLILGLRAEFTKHICTKGPIPSDSRLLSAH